ncbi:MAG: hypothetical protein MJ232_03055 [archaeon]|nr:hypothetical protein [archaeon]
MNERERYLYDLGFEAGLSSVDTERYYLAGFNDSVNAVLDILSKYHIDLKSINPFCHRDILKLLL